MSEIDDRRGKERRGLNYNSLNSAYGFFFFPSVPLTTLYKERKKERRKKKKRRKSFNIFFFLSLCLPSFLWLFLADDVGPVRQLPDYWLTRLCVCCNHHHHPRFFFSFLFFLFTSQMGLDGSRRLSALDWAWCNECAVMWRGISGLVELHNAPTVGEEGIKKKQVENLSRHVVTSRLHTHTHLKQGK